MTSERIVGVGDSIVKGVDYGGVTLNQTFIFGIGLACGYAQSDIFNAGKSSDTVAGVLARLYPDVIALNPDVCVLSIGMNDFVGGVPVAEFRASLCQIAVSLQAKGIKLTIISPNMRRGDAANFAGWEPYLKAMEGVVAQYELGYVDFYREMVYAAARGSYLPYYVDDIHLSLAGHQFVTEFCTRPHNKPAFYK